MAIWQFDLLFKPRPVNKATCDDMPKAFAMDDVQLKRRINGILPPSSSWSDDVLLWGTESGDRIQAVLSDDRIVELTARIDVRSPNRKFVDDLCRLAVDCDALLLTGDGTYVTSTVPAVAKAIRESDSFRFVSNPSEYYSDKCDE